MAKKSKRDRRPESERAVYARTNHANGGFKDNTPGGWVDTNGPVWWYGSDKAWLSPNGAAAGVAAVSRAINLIVNRIAAAPWRVRGAPELETPRWINDPMLLRPREDDVNIWPATMRVSKSLFWGAWIRHALSWGMGYLAFIPSFDGTPLAGSLFLLDPSMVDPDPDAWMGGTSSTRRINLKGRYVETDERGYFDLGQGPFRLVELRNPTTPLDPRTGVTPGTLAYHAAELGLIDAQVMYAASLYGGGGVPTGYLKSSAPGLDQEKADALKASWMAAHGSGTRGVAVLNSSTDYQAVGVSPVDSAIADMKKLSWQDVANAFGVPGWMLGAPQGTSMTYSNVEMDKQAFYEFTLMPWSVAVEEALTALIPGSGRLDITPGGEVSGDAGSVGAAGFGVPVPSGDVPQG